MFERLLNFGRSSTSHSESYNWFKKYLKVKGVEKRDGADADLLEMIYPEERAEHIREYQKKISEGQRI